MQVSEAQTTTITNPDNTVTKRTTYSNGYNYATYKDGELISSIAKSPDGQSIHYSYDSNTGKWASWTLDKNNNLIGKVITSEGSGDLSGSKPTVTDKTGRQKAADANTLGKLEKDLGVFAQIGGFFTSVYQTFTSSVSNFLIQPLVTYVVNPVLDFFGFSPIGAFYEAVNPAADNALSIAGKTPVLLGLDNLGLSAAQQAARDVNADGRLSGTELASLSVWADLNENGLLDAGELKTPANAGISQINSADYAFYTNGNGQPGAGVAATPLADVAAPSLAVPASNFRTLRDSNNHRTISMGTIVDKYAIIDGRQIPLQTHYGETQWYDWSANQIKQTNDNTTLVGTDSFDANYFSAVRRLPAGQQVNFLAGEDDAANDVQWQAVARLAPARTTKSHDVAKAA